VLLTARDEGRAARAATQLAAKALDIHPLALDVADTASVRAAATLVEQQFGRLDVLVNHAAAFASWNETASGADLDAARVTIETNLIGPPAANRQRRFRRH
jgi:NAD(P)-dependent dehydrogenase (short-subunit alcohol dehydrogenase family)